MSTSTVNVNSPNHLSSYLPVSRPREPHPRTDLAQELRYKWLRSPHPFAFPSPGAGGPSLRIATRHPRHATAHIEALQANGQSGQMCGVHRRLVYSQRCPSGAAMPSWRCDITPKSWSLGSSWSRSVVPLRAVLMAHARSCSSHGRRCYSCRLCWPECDSPALHHRTQRWRPAGSGQCIHAEHARGHPPLQGSVA